MPRELLKLMLGIEDQMGRQREIPLGPRFIDLDLLLYHDWNLSSHCLLLPHPRMEERRFVLVPLLELDPKLSSPRSGRSYREILETIDSDEQKVRPYSG